MLDIARNVEHILEAVEERNPAEPEFHQAVREVLGSLGPVLDRHPEYVEHKIVDRLCEPDARSSSESPGRTTKGGFT